MIQLPTSAQRVADYLCANIIGNPDVSIEGFSSAENLKPGQLTFITGKNFVTALKKKSEGGVILSEKDWIEKDLPYTFLVVADPQKAFAKIVSKVLNRESKSSLSPLAHIDPTAEIEEGVTIGPYAFIGARARIRKGTQIFANAYIDEDVQIGEYCQIFPFAVILAASEIHNRVKIFSGAVIGSEGFGFFAAKEDNELLSMPQIGKVVIEDDVRIGANCTIDRATIDVTRIKKNAKIDNLVQIGHNCEIGEQSILCAQVGIGGSTQLGKNVMLGGQAGISDHVTISDNVSMGAQSGTSENLAANEMYFGSPALPIKESLRVIKHLKKIGKANRENET